MRKYRTDIIQYTQNINLTSNCNAITFINTGTSNMYVEKYLIIPGQTLSINGNVNEIDTTVYKLEFTNNLGLATVIRKYYI